MPSCALFFKQMDTVMATQDEFKRDFMRYHECPGKRRPRVFHGNGGAQIPANDEEELEIYPKGYFTDD